MASHRHSQCFEGIINFSIPEPLAEDQGSHSQRRFYNNVNSNSTKDGFSRPLLVRSTCGFSRSGLSKAGLVPFKCVFFKPVELSFADGYINSDDELCQALIAIAALLPDYFYLPDLSLIHRPATLIC
ncbi:uncharacterized protein CIMG_09390 [Coccidioides immitis RS]|uniref:Uncharacterized protein n=1 Tax=Coccidioides immitis (strain RS) TaxID=246410 RepID=J3K287_COCIM|nr:uncharacterized protein CIMG_09390 [Coccidioides immitis RS]EAS28186.3 hypothetical protein CIMG_09390 [Coccidioides immitis RS]